MEIVWLATKSVGRFIRLVIRCQLSLHDERLGQLYRIDRGGEYAVFRETDSAKRYHDKPAVLVVGFRLKLISSNPLMHWLFQRLCIFTTPFWSGFKGFLVKLWMVDPKTKNYLGIYQWTGRENALVYVNALVRVLKAVSTPDSVWFEIFDNQTFEEYLTHRLVA